MIRFWNPYALHYSIDWSAWATLTAGLAAVIGAVIIGRRQSNIAAQQARIMEQQAKIAAQQVEIEETRLRAELYDRRLEVLSAIERYIAEAGSDDGTVSPEVRDGVYQALPRARHLLGEDVAGIARQALFLGISLRVESNRLERLSDKKAEDRHALIEKLVSYQSQLSELAVQLGTAADPYLQLSAARAIEARAVS